MGTAAMRANYRSTASAALPYSSRLARKTRAEHAHELAEDYVEIIAELIASTGEARNSDLARRLGVTHVTVGKGIRRLQREGLVTAQPYRSIFLTDAGRRMAEASRRRHQIVIDFLIAVGVPESVARSDAEGIEHHVSRQTLSAFSRYLRKP
jgi:DtxR family manganese transport transcriptional regulator